MRCGSGRFAFICGHLRSFSLLLFWRCSRTRLWEHALLMSNPLFLLAYAAVVVCCAPVGQPVAAPSAALKTKPVFVLMPKQVVIDVFADQKESPVLLGGFVPPYRPLKFGGDFFAK